MPYPSDGKLTRHAKVVDGTSKRWLELESASICINRFLGAATIRKRRSEPVPELKVLRHVQQRS